MGNVVMQLRQGDTDWLVDLRTPRGVRQRIGVSGNASRETAIKAATQHMWKVRQTFGEFMEKCNIISCKRINGSEV